MRSMTMNKAEQLILLESLLMQDKLQILFQRTGVQPEIREVFKLLMKADWLFKLQSGAKMLQV
jgi:hypothetical protein